MDKFLVIVESPTKAKTIRKFLPKEYIIESSMGHVRDLPQSAADIPIKYKKDEWAKLGVNVENDFDPLYIVPKGKSKIVKDLKEKMKGASVLYLATDEDREGESISWHLLELLKPKIPVKRMVFHEITKKAIFEALENCRDVNDNLVRAQEARRILDRLYGYTLSPLLWKKIAYGLSAGRVQSTGLKLIVERENERINFKKSVYWDLKAQLYPKKESDDFESQLIAVKGKKLIASKDFDSITGEKKNNDALILNEKESMAILSEIKNLPWKVTSIQNKEIQSQPMMPFITSTLQQEGNRKLGLSARDTMRCAQKLYESGLITYMRTDSPNLSSQAIDAARKEVLALYGKEYLSETPRQFQSKAKGAQEAHEAIRPAGERFVHPDDIEFTGKEKQLYELIWKRTMATQMSKAIKSSQVVKIEAGDCEFQANGTRIIFPGYLRVYVEGADDPNQALDNREVILPEMKEGDVLNVKDLKTISHETKAPPRYTEASLVQRLEKEGVGRPSTYASIISTIIDRNYARKLGTSIVPTFTGVAVAQLLNKNFPDLLDYSFTSEMENSLDEIAEGNKNWIAYLKSFYLGAKGLKSSVDKKEKDIEPETSRTIILPHIKNFSVKVGRFGPYVVANEGSKKAEEVHASIPENIAPADITELDVSELIDRSQKGPTPIGQDPKTGENIYCLVGRYGAYVQLGQPKDEKDKPKRASVTAPWTPQNITLEQALKFLSLPRELGKHPEKGETVSVNVGRFGPYVACAGEFRSLKKEDNVYEISLDRALEILNEEKKSRNGSQVIKEVDATATKLKKKFKIMNGKYGFYVKLGTKNITLPDDKKTPEAIEAWKQDEMVSYLLTKMAK